jgi:septum formation protein
VDTHRPRLVLASASPARQRTLAAAGLTAEVVPSGVDESSVDAATPRDLCQELARRKAEAVAERIRADGPDGEVLVLGCDSVLELDGEALGKPPDPAAAVQRWRRLRGRAGVLHTGHALVACAAGRVIEEVGSTVVHFADVSDAEIDAYVATGEPLEVAGGFTIDGRGGVFVERIEGDPGTVIGLSLPVLRRLLARLGTPVTALWRG